MNKLRLLVDFDETVHAYAEGKGNIIVGTKEALQELSNLGFEIYIYTSRLSTPENIEFHKNQIIFLMSWLKEKELPVIGITGRKLHAWGYIDDRTFRFKGDWMETLKEIKTQLILEREKN